MVNVRSVHLMHARGLPDQDNVIVLPYIASLAEGPQQNHVCRYQLGSCDTLD